MKTVFITINRGLVVRNLLRNDFFRRLSENKNIRTVIFFAIVDGRVPPDHLKNEFERENAVLEFVPNPKTSRLRRLFHAVVEGVIFSPTTKLYAEFGTIKVAPRGIFLKTLGKVLYPFWGTRFSRMLIWWIEKFVFRDHDFDSYFNAYRPDLVFSTAILSTFDLVFLKRARAMGIPALSMPKSWDNLDKNLFRFEPDLFLVQNDWMVEESLVYQKFKKHKIKTVGFPQFDIYRDPAMVEPREVYMERHGFDPKLPMLFLGSEGTWSIGDEKICGELVRARERGYIPNCNLLVRPHFSAIGDPRYEFLRTEKHVYIDDVYRRSDFFLDKWDPTPQDMADFTNTLRHTDVSLNFASTLSLDVDCFDKPIVNIAFGVRFEKDATGSFRDVTERMYETNYYRAVLRTGGTTLVRNYEELFQAIREYLAHPEIKRAERNKLRELLCFKVDGKSGERLYQELMNFL